MTDEKNIHLAGIVMTNGVAKFHTCGPKGVAAPFLQMPVPMANGLLTGTFAFEQFKEPLTKKEAAEALLVNVNFQNQTVQECLKTVIAKRTPVVKVPKPVAEKKAAKAHVVKTLKDAVKPAADDQIATLEKIQQRNKVAKRG